MFMALAIDTERQKLYFLEFYNQEIGELSTNGTDRRVLFTSYDDFYQPSVVFDDVNRWTFVVFNVKVINIKLPFDKNVWGPSSSSTYKTAKVFFHIMGHYNTQLLFDLYDPWSTML